MNTRAIVKQLNSEVAERKTQRQALDMEIAALEEAIGVLSGTPPSVPRSSRLSGSSYANTITDAIHDVLLEERPLRREVILEKVQGKGVHVGGKTPIATLGSYLSRDERFTNFGRGTWTLMNEPASIPSDEVANVPGKPQTPPDSEANREEQMEPTAAEGARPSSMSETPERRMNPLTGLTD